MGTFLWEGNSSRPLKHLVNWNITSKHLADGGFVVGGLARRNNALLAKWGCLRCPLEQYYQAVEKSGTSFTLYSWQWRKSFLLVDWESGFKGLFP